ncbi:MAG: hypothetical protein ACE5IQ_06675 [Candidatus Methylomirabilales bacterium]
MEHSRVFSYSPTYYRVPTLIMWTVTLLVPVLLLGTTSAWPERVFGVIVLLPIVGGMWWHHGRLKRRAWTIRVTSDGIIGESIIGETTGLTWGEIDSIEIPSLWQVCLDGMPRVILRSRNGRKEFIIGKNLRGYHQLAQIIKANTPYCSHDRL